MDSVKLNLEDSYTICELDIDLYHFNVTLWARLVIINRRVEQ